MVKVVLVKVVLVKVLPAHGLGGTVLAGRTGHAGPLPVGWPLDGTLLVGTPRVERLRAGGLRAGSRVSGLQVNGLRVNGLRVGALRVDGSASVAGGGSSEHGRLLSVGNPGRSPAAASARCSFAVVWSGSPVGLPVVGSVGGSG